MSEDDKITTSGESRTVRSCAICGEDGHDYDICPNIERATTDFARRWRAAKAWARLSHNGSYVPPTISKDDNHV